LRWGSRMQGSGEQEGCQQDSKTHGRRDHSGR
jgi:hypothetical protein